MSSQVPPRSATDSTGAWSNAGAASSKARTNSSNGIPVSMTSRVMVCGSPWTAVISGPLPVVDELQRDVGVGALEHCDDGLQVVALLAADADLVALDLGLDALGPVVADQ